MMNLLVLSPWFPYPPDNGSRQRIFHLVRELSKIGTIRLVAGVQDDSPPDVPEPLAALCAEVVRVPWVWHRGDRGGAASALRALVSPVPRSVLETRNPALTAAIAAQLSQPTDAVLVCELGMDAYLPPVVPAGVPLLLDGAEISGLERAWKAATEPRVRLRHGLTYAKGMHYWRQRFRRYHAITAASPGEADALRRTIGAGSRGLPPVIVIPNGVDVAAYPPRDTTAVVPGRMIYNGALTYGANRDAVAIFAREILPSIAARVPSAHLVVTGRYTDDATIGILPNPLIHLTGYLPDIQPALAQAAVCVVPLQTGGGTRLKILEAWAAGVPVVATSIGAAGLEGAVPGEHLVIAASAEVFSDSVARLLTHPELAARLSQNARRLAEEKYGWEAIGERLYAVVVGALDV